MRTLLTAIAFSIMVGCGTTNNNSTNVTAPTETTVAPTSVQQLVADQNAERVAQGQDPLTQGLDCYLYSVPSTTTAIIGATGLVGVGGFTLTVPFDQPNAPVTSGLNILPTQMQSVYQSYYIVKCTGYLVSGDSGWHEFDISSDDGSNLYIDGLLINNDGLHGDTDKTASKFLAYGFHSFEVDYFQGSGYEALILNEDGAVMGTSGFYH